MWQVVGQERVVALLQRCLEKDCLAHAYLVVGPPHVGKMTLALDLARALNCTATERPCGECATCQKITSAHHADVQVIGLSPDGASGDAKTRTEISIDQIREMQHAACLPPFEGNCRVFIIDGAEFLSGEAANCLLKTLEEPADKVVFALLTTNESLLPATVVSRCQRLELFPLPVARIESALSQHWGIEVEKARLLARLAHGCLGWAVTAATSGDLLQVRGAEIERLLGIIGTGNEERFAQAAQLATQFNQNRNSVYGILDLWQDYWRDLMLVRLGSHDIINIDQQDKLMKLAQSYSLAQIKAFIQSIQTAREQLRQNANPQLVLEVLVLDLPGKEMAVR